MYNYLENLKLLDYAHRDTSKLQVVHIRRILDCVFQNKSITNVMSFLYCDKQGWLGHFISGL